MRKIFILLVLILVSCNNVIYTPYEYIAQEPIVTYIKYPILTQSMHITQVGEHSEYVQIGTFQNVNSNYLLPHGIHAITMNLNNFDEISFLEIISAGRTPLIEVIPRDILMPFDKSNLQNFAKSLGIFNVSAFIKFFPNARSNNFDSLQYINFFMYAREVFRNYSPNAIFVWSIFENDVLDSHEFFPGSNYVDWVGITQKISLTENREHIRGAEERFSFFYHNYFALPILVTFGVSHFSTHNHSYHVMEAYEILENHYNFLLNFPRVRAILYSESNLLSEKDNFSITQSDILLNAYNKIILDERITRDSFSRLGGEEVLRDVRSPYYNIIKLEN